MNRLDGKIALITGGSKGLGEADARLFIAEGATVILTDIDDEAGNKIAEELGPKAEYHHHDVRDEARWKALIEDIVARHGGLHVLVNNAGVVVPGSIEVQTTEDFDFIMDVSAKGTYYGCKYAVPAMKKSGGGSIINMCSIASVQGEDGIIGYSAAKGAVQGMTLSIAAYCAKDQMNIRCNSLHPSSILTPMVENIRALINEKRAGDTETDFSNRKMVPMEELGKPEDIANTVVFLASDESRFINGAMIRIDNGKSIIPGVIIPHQE
ncbi:MAG: SDR family oxidoreductase [Porticoccaceae bacterium]